METVSEIIDIADRLIENGMPDKALAIINTGIEQYPDTPELYDLKAMALFKKLQVDEAIRCLEKAIETDPRFHLAYTHLAEIYNAKHDFENALVYAKKAHEAEPLNLYYEVLLAYTYLLLKEYQEVITICSAILNHSPSYSEAYVYRGQARLELKQYAKASADLELAYGNEPSRVLLLNDIGYAYSKANDIENAKYYLEKAIEATPGYSYPYDNLGYVYYLEKNYDRAHQLINRSLEMDPSNSYAYKNKALVYIAENELYLAVDALQTARQLKFDMYYGDEVDVLLAEVEDKLKSG